MRSLSLLAGRTVECSPDQTLKYEGGGHAFVTPSILYFMPNKRPNLEFSNGAYNASITLWLIYVAIHTAYIFIRIAKTHIKNVRKVFSKTNS